MTHTKQSLKNPERFKFYWYNNKRLFGSIDYVPPSELEAEYERQERGGAEAVWLTQTVPGNRDGSLGLEHNVTEYGKYEYSIQFIQ